MSEVAPDESGFIPYINRHLLILIQYALVLVLSMIGFHTGGGAMRLAQAMFLLAAVATLRVSGTARRYVLAAISLVPLLYVMEHVGVEQVMGLTYCALLFYSLALPNWYAPVLSGCAFALAMVRFLHGPNHALALDDYPGIVVNTLVYTAMAYHIRRLDRERRATQLVGNQLRDSLTTMKRMSYYDPLSNLPNRRYLAEQLEVCVRHAALQNHQVAVVFLDLDRFKEVNDSLGHSVGDEVIMTVADRLTEAVPENAAISRHGGDEFIILLNRVDSQDEVIGILKRVQRSMQEPFRHALHELTINVSIGVSLYPADGHDAETLLKGAAAAMHMAKQQGRNRYAFYQASMNERARTRLVMEGALRRAIVRKEFTLHYQPQVDARVKRVSGVEALIRWTSPEFGAVSPAEFIPFAEETGLITDIGAWVLREACKEAKCWQTNHNVQVPVAVNVSAYQLIHTDLVQLVTEVLAATQLAPRFLELEVTETAAIHDLEHVVGVMRRVNQLGVRFAIDDFGTGYSSLSHVHLLPVQTLKIDRQFVRDLDPDQASDSLVSSIITLAKARKFRVIAEGVETEAQWQILQRLMCDEIQGYVISKPLPSGEIAGFLGACAVHRQSLTVQ